MNITRNDYFSINTCKKDRWENLYYVAIRYYSRREGEKYIRTEFKVTDREWQEKTPKDKQKIYQINRILSDRIRTALQVCGVKFSSSGAGSNLECVTWSRFEAAMQGKTVSDNSRDLIGLVRRYLEYKASRPLEKDRLEGGTIDIYEKGIIPLLTRVKLGLPRGVKLNYDLDVSAIKGLKPHDISASRFNSKEKVEELAGLLSQHSARGIGNTTLSIYMRHLWAVLKIGASGILEKDGTKVRWIDADETFDDYKKLKPKSKKGTVPITKADYDRIVHLDVRDIQKNNKHHSDRALWQKHQTLQYVKDIWCMMVQAGGMEIASIARLRWSSVKADPVSGEYLIFQRDKVKKKQDKLTLVIIQKHVRLVFDRYAILANRSVGGYVFPILQEGMSPEQIRRAIKEFSGKVTDNMKIIGKHLNIDPLPNCKRTRPSFATIAREAGHSTEMISEQMSHGSLMTTQIYTEHVSDAYKAHVSKSLAQTF